MQENHRGYNDLICKLNFMQTRKKFNPLLFYWLHIQLSCYCCSFCQ